MATSPSVATVLSFGSAPRFVLGSSAGDRRELKSPAEYEARWLARLGAHHSPASRGALARTAACSLNPRVTRSFEQRRNLRDAPRLFREDDRAHGANDADSERGCLAARVTVVDDEERVSDVEGERHRLALALLKASRHAADRGAARCPHAQPVERREVRNVESQRAALSQLCRHGPSGRASELVQVDER